MILIFEWMVRSDFGIFLLGAQRRPIVVDGISIGIGTDNTLLYELHIFPALHNLTTDFSPRQNIRTFLQST